MAVKKDEKLTMFEKEANATIITEDKQLARTKEKLAKYTNLTLNEEEWLEKYEAEFIARHGSKIYSLVQLYGQR